MEQEIIKADPKYRKKVLIFIVIAAFVAILTIAIFTSQLQTYISANDLELGMKALRNLIIALLVPPIGFALWMIFIATRAYKQHSFPPQGYKVIKDTIRHTGSDARKRALIVIFLSVLIMLASFYAMYSASCFIIALLPLAA